LCDMTIQTPTVCHPWHLGSGNPCRNDEVGAGKLYHLEFSHYRKLDKAESAGILPAITNRIETKAIDPLHPNPSPGGRGAFAT